MTHKAVIIDNDLISSLVVSNCWLDLTRRTTPIEPNC